MSANTETTGADRTWFAVGDRFESDDSGPLTLHEEVNPGHWRVCWGSAAPRGLVSTDVLATWKHLPPIAAPAAHVERRKGQRWRYQYKNETPREYVLEQHHLGGTEDWPSSGWSLVGREWGWFDSAWSTENITMTLLADTPPEPAKRRFSDAALKMGCDCAPNADCATCRPFCNKPAQEAPKLPRSRELSCSGGCGIRAEILNQFFSWSCPACTKKRIEVAQEAPKTAPVCDIARDTHAGPVLMRWIKSGQGAVPSLTPVCEQCHVLSERAGRFGGVFPASILHDKDVPTRLPRPQLAADWVEDCLPEAGR